MARIKKYADAASCFAQTFIHWAIKRGYGDGGYEIIGVIELLELLWAQ